MRVEGVRAGGGGISFAAIDKWEECAWDDVGAVKLTAGAPIENGVGPAAAAVIVSLNEVKSV